jgi:hypothetical protein
MPDPTPRDIPEPIKRHVRQRCGFGCVICGLPLFEYEHLKGWANVQRHMAEEITLLCDRHHREKTAGLLPLADVAAADVNPFNRRAGVSASYDLHFAGNRCELVIGSNRAVIDHLAEGTGMCALMVDGVSLAHFRLSEGRLLLSFLLFDEINRLILRVLDNEVVYVADIWDIELVGTNLVLRQAARQILADIVFDPDAGRVIVSRGRFLLNGVEVLITPDYALVVNNRMQFSHTSIENCAFGLVLGEMPQEFGAAVRITGIPRYLGDRTAAKQWADANMADMRGHVERG